jgi:hypothetical protein
VRGAQGATDDGDDPVGLADQVAMADPDHPPAGGVQLVVAPAVAMAVVGTVVPAAVDLDHEASLAVDEVDPAREGRFAEIDLLLGRAEAGGGDDR